MLVGQPVVVAQAAVEVLQVVGGQQAVGLAGPDHKWRNSMPMQQHWDHQAVCL